MGDKRPKYIDQDGDESVLSPSHEQASLLGTEEGTDRTRRVLVTSDGSLKVSTDTDNREEDLLHSGSSGPINANTVTTVSTYVAPAAVIVYGVCVSGEAAADVVLKKNLATIGIKRTNLELDKEFRFEQGLPLASSDTLSVEVEHFSTGKTKTFDMFIYGE